MDGIVAGFVIMGITILAIVLTIICLVIGVIILMTLWALVRPHIGWIIDKWWDWFDKRVE